MAPVVSLLQDWKPNLLTVFSVFDQEMAFDIIFWSGPPDKQIGYGVMGVGQDSVQVRVKWNASGIQQEQTISAPSAILIGQYIESVVVSNDRDDSDVTLTIREGGRDIYTSEALKGKGSIEYKRK